MTRQKSTLLFVLILVLRLSIAAQYRGNFDSQSYLIAASATLAGQNIYAATDRYNYSPVWSWIVAAIWKASAPNASVFVLAIGILLIAVDILTAALVLAIGGRRLGFQPGEARRSALLFFSNPVSVLISCAHGQFDGFSILFLLAAIFVATGPHAERIGKALAVAAALTASLLVKHVTAFHLLLFWRRIRRPGYSLGLLAAPVVLFLLSFWQYRSALSRIVQSVVVYGMRTTSRWQQHVNGWPALFPVRWQGTLFMAALFLLSVVWAVVVTRKIGLPRAALVLFLSNIVFLPSSAVQYAVWPIALGSLFSTIPYAVFTTAAALYHSSAPESLAIGWPIVSTPLGIWFCALVWLAAEVWRIRRVSAEPFSSPQAFVRAEDVARAVDP